MFAVDYGIAVFILSIDYLLFLGSVVVEHEPYHIVAVVGRMFYEVSAYQVVRLACIFHIAGRFDNGVMVICSVGNEFTVAADLILPELVIVSAVVVQIYRNGVAVFVEGGNRFGEAV